MMIAPSPHYHALDGLRGIAALGVMCGHFGQLLGAYWPPHMFLAVDMFFVMSGFVIAHAYGAKLRRGMPAHDYLARRMLRLYPMFIAGLLLGGWVLYIGTRAGAIHYRTSDILRSMALNAFYIPYLNAGRIFHDDGQIFPADPPAWSLFLEMLASGGFLMLYALGRRTLILLTGLTYLLLVATGITFAQLHGGAWLDLSNGFDTKNFLGGIPRVAFGFTLGVLLHALAQDGVGARYVDRVLRRLPFPTFVLYAILIGVFVFPKAMHGVTALLALTLVMPALVFIAAQVTARRGPEMTIANFLGWISYPVYCLHVPIVRLAILQGGSAAGTRYPIMAASAAVTLVMAMTLAKFYEGPVRAALSAGWLEARVFFFEKKKQKTFDY